MATHTLTPDMKLSLIHDTLRRAKSGDTILVPPDEVPLVKRALRGVCPEKTLTVKPLSVTAAANEVTP